MERPFRIESLARNAGNAAREVEQMRQREPGGRRALDNTAETLEGIAAELAETSWHHPSIPDFAEKLLKKMAERRSARYRPLQTWRQTAARLRRIAKRLRNAHVQQRRAYLLATLCVLHDISWVAEMTFRNYPWCCLAA